MSQSLYFQAASATFPAAFHARNVIMARTVQSVSATRPIAMTWVLWGHEIQVALTSTKATKQVFDSTKLRST